LESIFNTFKNRVYPWGICNVEDIKHTDFIKLYELIINYGFNNIVHAAYIKYKVYMQKLKKKTEISKELQKKVFFQIYL